MSLSKDNVHQLEAANEIVGRGRGGKIEAPVMIQDQLVTEAKGIDKATERIKIEEADL